MKITLLNIRSNRRDCINKDFMGGYGWAFNAGESLAARLINLVKRWGEKLPLLSFGYLAAILSRNGFEVDFKTNVIPDSDMVIMSSSMVDYRYELDWARRIKQKGINVGFIGPFASHKPELFLNNCDFVIKGEPEEAAMLMKGNDRLSGLIQSRPVEDLDTLPFPKWDIFPIASYSYFPALKERPFLPVLASRGCAYQCNYCPYVTSYKYRSRSAAGVLDEIVYLKEQFRIRGMIFRDPLFGTNRDFVTELCGKMIKKGLRLRWVCETRLNLLDKELLNLMFKAGLRVINTGVESADPDLLKKSTRIPVQLEHQEQIIRHADKLGIRVTAFYIIGLPGDTKEGILRTIAYAKRLNTHVAQFFVHTPFPGTEYFEQVKNRIIQQDWQKFDCYTPVLRHDNLSPEEILALKERAFLSYYYRPSYALRFAGRFFRDILS